MIENSSSHASVPQALYLLNSPLNIAIHNSNSILGGQLASLQKPEDKIDLVTDPCLQGSRISQKSKDSYQLSNLRGRNHRRLGLGSP